MKIRLREQLVVPINFAETLKQQPAKAIRYKDPDHPNNQVKIIFGIAEMENDYGVMLFHQRRLINFQKVKCQSLEPPKGKGVVGVVDVKKILTPDKNKQDFKESRKYAEILRALENELNKYWKSNNESSTEDKRKNRKRKRECGQSILPCQPISREQVDVSGSESDRADESGDVLVQSHSPVPGPSHERQTSPKDEMEVQDDILSQHQLVSTGRRSKQVIANDIKALQENVKELLTIAHPKKYAKLAWYNRL